MESRAFFGCLMVRERVRRFATAAEHSATTGAEGYRSGQTGQTVNLMALPSQVRILHSPSSFINSGWLSGGGLFFESCAMMTEMSTPAFWDSGLRFACTQCSKCCRHDSGYVFLSEQDLSGLCEFTDLDAVDFVDQYCVWVPFGPDAHLSLAEQANHDCIFWKEGGCSVYDARPLQCRTYPFWGTIVDEEQHWDEEARECPGIGIGRARGPAEIASAVTSRRLKPPMLRSEFNEKSGDTK